MSADLERVIDDALDRHTAAISHGLQGGLRDLRSKLPAAYGPGLEKAEEFVKEACARWEQTRD